jgi:CubicO group peptidase (beta-lactamase class C family)
LSDPARSAPGQAPSPEPAQQGDKAKTKAKLPALKEQKAGDPLAGFDEWVEGLRKEWKIPGLAVAVVKDGQIVHAKGYGLRNVEKNLPVTADTLFAIGSNTKAFTAAGLALLVAEGKLDWDKPIREYIPSFKMWDDYVTERMTPRDLVTHRSGLPRHDLLWYGSSLTRKQMFERLRYLEPSRGFRDRYQYQNLMFMTAGYLIEQITGQLWEQYTGKRFFEPMEMRTSNFSVAEMSGAADASLPYEEDKGNVKVVPYRNIDQIGPAGSINSSVREMAAWLIVQLDKGKYKDKQVIPEAQLRITQSPQTVIPPSPTAPAYDELFYNSYAMGWVISAYRGHLMQLHGGGIDGFISQVSMLPKQKVGVVVLTNLSPNAATDVIVYNVYDRFLGLQPVDWNQRRKEERAKAREAQEKAQKDSEAARKKDTHPSHALAEYAGKYEHPGYGTLTLAENSGSLKASYNSLTSPLRHYHFDVFEATDARMQGMKFSFGLNAKGDVDRVLVPLQSGVADMVFTRAPEGKQLEKAALERLLGEYQITVAPQTIKVWLRDEKALMLTVPGQPDYELVQSKGFEFRLMGLQGFRVEFKLGEAGPAAEVVFTQPNGVFTAKRK